MKITAWIGGCLIAVACAGCAGPGPGVTGDKSGGIIPWSPANQALAFDLADAHCATYAKRSRITSVYAEPGAYIGFACLYPRGYIVRQQVIRQRGSVLRTRG